VFYRIFEGKVELVEAAAVEAATAICGEIKERGHPRIVAATGASRLEFLEALTATTGIAWQEVELFPLDQYIGIPVSHPASGGGFGAALLIPTIPAVNLHVLTLLFALATFSYASFNTIANVLPSDLYKNESVATVSGLSGTGPPSARSSFSNWRAIFAMRV
jgi:6-phosphogluconolactonase/glucosamine-6-phosphate isomerase/deaminase